MKQPTRRSLWPLAIVGYFVVAIIFLTFFVVVAVRNHDDLVSSDYYEREVRFQTQLDSMNRSRDIAAQTAIKFEPAASSILITLPADKTESASGTVHLYRPSDARLDREFSLALDATGMQRVDTKNLPEGLWKVRVNWTSNGADYFLDQSVLVSSL